MCLIVLIHRSHPDAPLIFAANRDERRDRPSAPMQLLEQGPPAIAGGRDLVAGGTWMAIGAHGVVAGLTNQNGPSGPDPRRRSRGEIPLLLARAQSADRALETAHTLDSKSFNPCTLFVADPHSAHYVEFLDTVTSEALPPGLHILENRLRGVPSPKADSVAAHLGELTHLRGVQLRNRLESVLANRTIPSTASSDRSPALNAARVELGSYGTRSSTLVFGSDASVPDIWYVDAPPGDAPFERHSPFA